MSEVLCSPVAWLTYSIIAYDVGLLLQRKLRTPLANPLLIAAAILCAVLVFFDIPLAAYQTGGAFISLFLTPATVAVAVPIYRQLETLRANLLPIVLGALAGSVTSIVSVILLCRLFGLQGEILYSLIPKSITTPIGVEISASLGGLPAVTTIAIILTGLFGAVALPGFLRLMRLTEPVTVGIAIGTASHAVGTSRAITLGEIEGAMSGLAIGIAGLITTLLVSIWQIFL